MRFGARASIFSRSFLLQPRPIDDVYRWVRIDFGVRCLYACRNRSMLSGKAQKAARRSALSIDQLGEHSRIASVACLSTVRKCSWPCRSCSRTVAEREIYPYVAELPRLSKVPISGVQFFLCMPSLCSC